MQVPAPFEYQRAESIDDALMLLERYGEDARVVAGGHSLLPMMKLRLARPELLVDINDLAAELDYLRLEGDLLRIGALTRHRTLLESELVGRLFPIFHDAERVIADPPVRNRGTIGGALCQADPAEDLSAVCSAVKARVVIRGRGGDRVVPMPEFYRGPYETAVGVGEMLIEVGIPVAPGSGSAYEKVERKSGDWAVAAAGASVTLAGGRIADAGVGLAAVGSEVLNGGVAAALIGAEPSERVFAEAGRIAAEGCDPATDGRGTAEYKRHLAGELTVRALRRAAARATAAAAAAAGKDA
ncbi:MAG TPA: xanthine dehydrogenase family protein subunit M [Actinocrinis sp.]